MDDPVKLTSSGRKESSSLIHLAITHRVREIWPELAFLCQDGFCVNVVNVLTTPTPSPNAECHQNKIRVSEDKPAS